MVTLAIVPVWYNIIKCCSYFYHNIFSLRRKGVIIVRLKRRKIKRFNWNANSQSRSRIRWFHVCKQVARRPRDWIVLSRCSSFRFRGWLPLCSPRKNCYTNRRKVSLRGCGETAFDGLYALDNEVRNATSRIFRMIRAPTTSSGVRRSSRQGIVLHLREGLVPQWVQVMIRPEKISVLNERILLISSFLVELLAFGSKQNSWLSI